MVEKKIIDALVADGKKKNSDDAEPVIRGALLADLKAGKLRNTKIDIKIVDNPKPMEIMPGMGAAIDLNEIFGGQFPKKTKTRTLTVAEATQILMVEESDKLIDNDSINAEAVRRAEQEGIVFIDEIDKIAAKGSGSGPDVSREGVQRDILPIIEGSTVMTKYGAIRTDYILFIASGAFHISKIEDLIPELQGRFPIRVELQSLTKKDFFNILIQPDNAITKQYTSLLAVDNIKLEFTDEAIDEISEIAFLENETSENIGARRLHTVMESLLEDISFNASGDHPEIVVTIDRKYVVEHLTQAIKKHDLKKYIL
ncbi:MAG: HslU--HslV peptidase ATPase subunit [Clostridiales bacterium]|nr:HslU--HslV peptidase ATPase subunit [Clostridiales bacterium]